MFRLFIRACLVMSVLLVLPLVADEKIRCESKGGKRVCRAAETISSVVMLKQLSMSECKEGESWGYNRDAVWVDSGCRADFQVMTRRGRDNDRDYDRDRDHNRDNYGRGGSRLICESTGERQFCRGDVSDGVTLSRTLGESKCVEGRSWGVGERGVWVDRGCRAEFILGRDRDHRRPLRTDIVRCESKDNHRRLCRVEAFDSAEIKNQLSMAECTFEKTWGFNREGVWVTDGCRADFLVRMR